MSRSFAFAYSFIISFIGGFACGYFMCEIWIAPDNVAAKALAGGIGAFLTLLVDTTLFLLREHKVTKKEEMQARTATAVAAAKGVGAPASKGVKGSGDASGGGKSAGKKTGGKSAPAKQIAGAGA